MGCKISVSGFEVEERYRLRDLIHSLRGVYCPDFTADCTHLVANHHPGLSSAVKLEMAKKWSIPVLKVDWLESCERERRLVDWQASSFLAIDQEDCNSPLQPDLIGEINENCAPFLNGCHVYLEVAAPLQLKRIILAAGGVRHTDPASPFLTHALIHQQVMPAELPRQLAQGVLIVHDGWVVDSFRAQQRLPEKAYAVNLGSGSSSSSTLLPIVNSSFSFSTSFILPAPVPPAATASQLATQLSTPTIISKTKSLELGKQAVFSFQSYPRQPEGCLLRVKKLLAKAKRLGVSVSREASKADFAVLPCLLWDQMGCTTGITDVLFESLLDALKDDSSATVSLAAAYARPVRLKRKGCLNGCIFSQTGFTGPSREFNVALVQGAGAIYTDNLSRQNTHLIVDDVVGDWGIKREFAKKWEIAEVGGRELVRVLREGGELKNDKQKRMVALRAKKGNPLDLLVLSSQSAENQVSSVQIVNCNDSHNFHDDSNNPNNVHVSNNSLFNGLVFAFSQRLHHRRDQLRTLLESRGAAVLRSLSAHCTHYLHQGNQTEECFKEFKQAKGWGCKIVSPVWVEESIAVGVLKDEFEYPHTFKRELQTVLGQPNQTDRKLDQPDQQIDWNEIVRERQERAAQLRPRGNIDFSCFNIAVSAQAKSNADADAAASLAAFSTPLYLVFSGFTAPQKESLRSQLPNDERLTVTAEAPACWSAQQSLLLVADSITASEKFFSACASGSW
jgi:hypothetical protein